MTSTPETISTFVQFCHQHIKGDEKGEAQVFLDCFFRAFGHEWAIEAGATYEKRVKKGSMQAYGFSDTADLLEKLLALNPELAAKEQCGEPVVGCWTP